MVPVLPGATGSLVHSGVVQPQLTPMLLITNGWVPVFLNLNTWSTISPWLMGLNSYLVSSKTICGPATFSVALAAFMAWAWAV